MSLRHYLKTLLLITAIPFFYNGSAQKIASLEVMLPEQEYDYYIPLSVVLDQLTFLSDTSLALFEIRNNLRHPVPFQIENGNTRKIHWIAEGTKNSSGRVIYELVRKKADQDNQVTATVKDGTLLIHKGEQNLLQYYFRTLIPQSGIDPVFSRSGFIHPLWSPHGQILTRIQPPDHLHHFGIWNPWTHVLFEGDTIDFWNLGSGQGTVRFASFASITDGAVFSEFTALHEHVVFKKSKEEKVAINELQRVKIYTPARNQDIFIVEFTIQLSCAGDSPVKLLEYRYGGLGWRTTEKWDRYNSTVLTSEGKTRKDADGSRARWCNVQGEIDDDFAGVVMMAFPTNYNYPEPLRIWPEDQYGRGDMFVNFSPTKNMSWILHPRQSYVLKYRFLVYNGHTDKDKAEEAWNNYAYPPEIKISK